MKTVVITEFNITVPSSDFVFDLNKNPVNDCIGCWTCWWKTLGRFIYKDLDYFYHQYITADKVIYIAKDYALAEAAKPILGNAGLYMTVTIAIVATFSGVVASVFAVSRMTAMLVDMKLIPHSHFGMPGTIQKHMLVYVVVIAIVLTIFFDLSRIASMGAILYLIMDAIIHWGVLRHLRKETKAKPFMMILALIADIIILGAFIRVKIQSDLFVVIFTLAGIALIFIAEKIFLSINKPSSSEMTM